MWFKQTKLFQLTNSANRSPINLIDKLEGLVFKPCRPSMQSSMGWVSPIDEEDAPLVQTINGRIMLCLQIEEKILPAVVIAQELIKKIKEIEKKEDRKVRQKEKYVLKDEIIATLLPRAFSRLTRVYAYIDTQNNWLVLGTNNEKRTEQFIKMFKKSEIGEIHPFEIKKLSSVMTNWLQRQTQPSSLSIEKSCLLQDPNQENRMIRCQQQDLFSPSIQSLLKDGCEVKQLALTWHDRVTIVLSDDFSLSSIKFQEGIAEQIKEMEAETAQQKFHADFFIMSETFAGLFEDLLTELIEPQQSTKEKTNSGKVIPMVKLA
jgi:recombination associated protein RdgC